MTKINYPLFIILFLFISVLLIVFVLFPNYRKISELRSEIATKKGESESLETYFQDLEADLEKLNNYQSELSKIDAALPEENSFPSLFNFLLKSAQSAGLIFKEIGAIGSPSSSQISGFQENETIFSVSGSYSALKNFVTTLEKSARLIQINNISFSVDTETEEILPGQEMITDYELTIKIYSH